VAELKAIDAGETPVLLLDGEELVGHPVHLGFFRLDPQESVPPIAGMRERRRWRVE